MGVELIGDEDPGGFWIGLERLGDVSGKVGFGARGTKAGSHDLSGGHIKIGDQTQGAMALLFKFLSLDMTRLHGQVWMLAFQCLNPG